MKSPTNGTGDFGREKLQMISPDLPLRNIIRNRVGAPLLDLAKACYHVDHKGNGLMNIKVGIW